MDITKNFADYMADAEATLQDVIETPVETVVDEPETIVETPELVDNTIEETQEDIETPAVEQETVVETPIKKPKGTPDAAMRDYRVRAEKAEKEAHKYAEMATKLGMSQEELFAELERQATEQLAEREGISVDVAKRFTTQDTEINTLKQQLEFYQTQQLTLQMQSNIQSLQKEFGIAQTDVDNFMESLVEDGYTQEMLAPIVLNQKALSTLYRGKNTDLIFEKKRQDELKQKDIVRKTTPLVPTQTQTTPQLSAEQEMLAEATKVGQAWANVFK